MTRKEAAQLLNIPDIELVRNAKHYGNLPMENEDWINAFKWYNLYYFRSLNLRCRPCYDKVLNALLEDKK